MRRTRDVTRSPPHEPSGVSVPTLMQELAQLQRELETWPAGQENGTATRVAALRTEMELRAWAREREQQLIDQRRRSDADDRQRRRVERQAAVRGWIRTCVQATGLVALVAATAGMIEVTARGESDLQTMLRLIGL